MKARKVLSILLSLAMTLSLVNVTAFAENEDPSGVAEIGGGRYETLAEAVSAAQNGDTITLLKDVTLTSTLEIQKSITLDLNGKTLTKSLASASDKAPLIKALSGTAEIKNGAITYDISTYTGTAATSNANVINVGMNMSNGIYSGGDCDLTLNGVDVSVTFPKGKSLSMIYVESGKLNVISSNLSATNVSGNTATQYLIYTTAHASAKVNPYVSISGSATLDTNSSAGIHAIWLQGVNDTLAISGNDVTISADATWKPNSYTTSYAYAVNNQSGATCTIGGGKFLGKVWQTKGTIDVSGGYFGYAQGTSGQKNKITLAEGVEYLENTDSATMATYPYVVAVPVSYVAEIGNTKYETLAEAIAAVPTDGTEATITMIADETVSDVANVGLTVGAGKNIVLDLNGKTISGVSSLKSTHFIDNKGTLEITDSSANEDGKITFCAVADAGYSVENITIYNIGGKLTLTKGTIENTTAGGLTYAVNTSSNAWGTGDDKYSEFTMTGGRLAGANTDNTLRVYQNCAVGNVASHNTVSISGGVIDNGIFVDTFLYNGNANTADYVGANIDTRIDISGGTINGLIDLKIRHPFNTILNITGGDFTNAKLQVRKNNEYNAAFSEPAEPMVNISGGDFTFANTGKTFLSAYDSTTSSWTTYANQYILTGGTYNVNPAAAYIAEGYEAVDNSNGTWTVQPAITAIAEINGVRYASLAEAIAAAKDGDTVTLLKDTTLGEAVTLAAGTITILQNGFEIGDAAEIIVPFGTTLIADVITNRFVTEPGYVIDWTTIGNTYTYTVTEATWPATVTHEGVDTNYETANDAMWAAVDGDTITLNEDTASSLSPKSGKGAITLDLNGKTASNGVSGAGSTTLTVTGGTITKGTGSSVKAVSLSGGTGSVILEDVTVTSTGYAIHSAPGYNDTTGSITVNGGTYTGATGAIFVEKAGGSARTNGGEITINGGTFYGAIVVNAGTLTIYGGTFDHDPSAYVAEGYEAVDNGDGTWTVAPADVYTAAAVAATGTLSLGGSGSTFRFTITKNGTKLTKTAEYSAELANWELDYDPTYIELTKTAASGTGIGYTVKALKAGETTITFRNIADHTITASTVLTNKHAVSITYDRGTDATGNKYLLEKGTLTITKITFDGVAYIGADLDTFLASHTLTPEGNATIDGLNVTPNATGNVYIHVTDKEDATVTARSGLLNFVTAAAQIGNDYYVTLTAAFKAAQNGDTITLISDITEYVNFGGTAPRATEFALTLELNGHTFTAPANENFALRVQYGVITIKDSVGTGAIQYGKNSAILVDHLAGDYPSKVIIESGTFTGKSTVVQTGYPGGSGANYKYYGGELEVLGGTFVTVADTNENYDANGNFRYTLNMLDMIASAYAGGIYSESSITVKGGTFNGFDPANNAAEGAGTNFVPEGYESVETTTGTWTVREVVQNVAEVNGVGYPTLAEAIAAANELDNAMVTLLRDYDMEANEPGYGYTTSYVAEGEITPRNNMIELSGTGLTLDLGGHALTNLFNNTFTVTGENVTIQNGTMELGQLYYGSYSTQKGVTLYATPTYGSYVVFVNGASDFVVNNLTTFGGINVSASTATINNLSFSGLSFYAVCSQSGSVVTLNGGSYNKAITGAANYLFWVQAGSTMNITGGTFTKGTTTFINGVKPVITGGTFDFDPTNSGVAEGYEAASIGEGLYQVGKLEVSEITPAQETTEGYDATYTITKQVVSTDGEDNVLAENNAITVNVKAITENTPASDTTIEKIDSTALQTIISQAIEASDTSATEIEVQIEVVRDEPALETTGATPTITYEVHPVVKAFVGEALIGTEQIGNDSLAENASFTITLPVPDVLVNASGQVKVSHISEDYGTEVNVYDVAGEAGNYTVTFTVTHFSSFELAIAELEGTGSADLGASLSLTDNIEINLYVTNLKDVNGVKEVDPGRFKVAYTFNGERTETTLTSADSNRIVVATCAAKEIGDIVTIELYYDSTLVRQLEYSARMYCEGKIENSSEEKLVELCYALLDYGAYAQLRFDYKTQELANETYTRGTVESVSIPSSYAAEVSGATYIVNNIGASLSLESKTEVNVYFISNDGSTAASGNYAVYVNDTRMTISDTEEGMICANIPGIVAKDLGETIEIIIDKAGEKMTVSYSPLSYAYRNQSDSTEGNVVKALYKYYLAAASYFEE